MNTKLLKLCVFFILLITLPLASQQRNVAVTVYNDNMAVVKDVRLLSLQKGVFELSYQNVAADIIPTSVHFKSLTAPGDVQIFEQNYEYDLVSSDKILDKYVDKQITVSTKQDGQITGTLLSDDSKYVVLQIEATGVKLVSRNDIVHIDFPELPEGLITRPTLVWELENKKAGDHQTEVSYITNGMNWQAEYVAVSKDEDQAIELNAWVSINNQSGADYPNAKLKLVAGDVHRVREPRYGREVYREDHILTAQKAIPEFEEKAFFEYHLYTLDQPTDINDNQIKQISLFSTPEAKSKKIYTYDPNKSAEKVRVELEFKNSKENGLGLPLPAGKVRVYKEDPADKSLEFIGEDNIDHTPQNEDVRIYLGNAFDIVAEQKMVEKESTGKYSRKEQWEVEIRNHKDSGIQVLVVKRFYGFLEIKKSTHRYKKESANELHFFVDVPKEGESTLNFEVEISRNRR